MDMTWSQELSRSGRSAGGDAEGSYRFIAAPCVRIWAVDGGLWAGVCHYYRDLSTVWRQTAGDCLNPRSTA